MDLFGTLNKLQYLYIGPTRNWNKWLSKLRPPYGSQPEKRLPSRCPAYSGWVDPSSLVVYQWVPWLQTRTSIEGRGTVIVLHASRSDPKEHFIGSQRLLSYFLNLFVYILAIATSHSTRKICTRLLRGKQPYHHHQIDNTTNLQVSKLSAVS